MWAGCLSSASLHTGCVLSYLEDYARLGIPGNANKEEIKAAYFRKAKLLHPDSSDKQEGAELSNDFLELNEAYKRLMYEQTFKEKGLDMKDPR